MDRVQYPDAKRIVVGAGEQRYDGWLSLQESDLRLDYANDWNMLFEAGQLTHILAEHVWEHLSENQAVRAIDNFTRFLAPGGRIRIAVPDGLLPDETYQRMVQVGGPGPADHPAASHKVVYTCHSIGQPFLDAGMRVDLLEWWDRNGMFHQTDWDEQDGFVYRTMRNDHRNADGEPRFTSLLIDAIMPD